MRAIRLNAPQALEVADIPEPEPGPGEVLVELKAAALNHRDAWMHAGQYANLKFPCIPGSDGAGVVVAAGPGASRAWIGKEVIIDPAFDWGPDPKAQADQFTILGLPRQGTFAEKIAVPALQLADKPPGLTWEEAAAVPLAGLTAWRALMSRGGFTPLDRVLISGIGGGVALFALQFAAAHEAEVWVTSSSEDKISLAVAHGARGGFLYTQEGWAKEAVRKTGGFDLIVDGAGGAGFNQLIESAAPGGRIVFYGATRGNPPELSLRKVFWRQLSLHGTTMGGPADWLAMTDFMGKAVIKPVISEVFPFERAAEAFELMERGGQFGKIVLRMASSGR
ncbi:MAG TPA: zinc-binding dehydrogenase [Opitutaceae bacterium]|jgi:NADPH:quinone reductase-like Zn-dependent oxidoreductase|nr:zinc-binding dehydrogenase [Opitutaceae bacterium]